MRHHYVPQFLLNAWSEGSSDKKLEVFRLDLPNLPSARRTAKHTGFDHDLYALTKESIGGMEKQAIEKLFLKRIDNDAAVVRTKLLTQGLSSLTQEDRVNWTRFIMSLRLRQPDLIKMLKEDSAKHLRANLNTRPQDYEEIAGGDDPITLEEWTEKQYPGLIENFGLSTFQELVDNPVYGDKILAMKWWLWDFGNVSVELLLSDHPCIFTKGIDEPDCVVALPIHPRKAFMATQSESVAALMRQQDVGELAVRMNESVINQAQVRIYASDELQRTFIEGCVKQRKQLESTNG